MQWWFYSWWLNFWYVHVFDVLFCIGETDWKVIVIDVTDPLANELNGEILSSLDYCIYVYVCLLLKPHFLSSLMWCTFYQHNLLVTVFWGGLFMLNTEIYLCVSFKICSILFAPSMRMFTVFIEICTWLVFYSI